MRMTLLDNFRKVAEQIATELEIGNKKIQIDHSEGDLGVDYMATVEGEKGFTFVLSTDRKEGSQKETMNLSLTIYFREGVAPYYFDEDIDHIVDDPDLLDRWASWAIFNFRQTHEKVSLESLFHEATIRVYGIPQYCDPAEGEAQLLFNGLLATQEGKVLIYRFRHIDSGAFLCRSISYAVCVSPLGFPVFWVVFPGNCGLDSGRGRSTYQHIEALIDMIKQKHDVEIRNYDVVYEELDTFLLRRSTGFFSVFRDNELPMLLHHHCPSEIFMGSEKQFEDFMKRLERKEYAQALRDLRALVQQAEENAAKLKKLDYSSISGPDVIKLASFLISKGQIDGRLHSWFFAFTSVANLASHRDFPTKQDMADPVLRARVLLTFHLGINLIEELDKIVSPDVPVIDIPPP
jgi:hypothetical protein